jgi:hypothetical protein
VKPFATLGSEISKVRERVRRSAESLRPAKVASDVRDQRDRLLAKLGEQTFRLIAERKLVVPKMLQESVERLASLLGVQLPPLDPSAHAQPSAPAQQPPIRDSIAEGVGAVTSSTLGGYDAEIDEPSVGDAVPAAASKPAQPQKAPLPQKSQKKGAKKHKKR